MQKDTGKIIKTLLPLLTPERVEKLTRVVSCRSEHFIAVMENIYDQGNINAVIRSSESFGFYRLGQIQAEGAGLKETSRISRGAHKWVHVTRFQNPQQAIEHYQSQGYAVGATVLSRQALALEEVDFTRPTVMVFGNEKDGCGPEVCELSDFHCAIKTVGFTQSLNLSVAAAITFAHVRSQLKEDFFLSEDKRDELLAQYLLDSFAHRPALVEKLFQ